MRRPRDWLKMLERQEMLKGQMYGRAGLDLLRRRVLFAAWPREVRESRGSGVAPGCRAGPVARTLLPDAMARNRLVPSS